MFPRVVSFYSDAKDCDYFHKQAKNLLADCERLNLDHTIVERPSAGSWSETCRQKPLFIYEQLTLSQQPILWIDCDNRILEYPKLLENFEADLAIAHHQFPPRKDVPWMSSTIAISPNEKTNILISKWIELCNNSPDFGDHFPLVQAIKEFQFDLNILFLPVTYACLIPNRLKDETAVISCKISKFPTKPKGK